LVALQYCRMSRANSAQDGARLEDDDAPTAFGIESHAESSAAAGAGRDVSSGLPPSPLTEAHS
jgi:hypothetical protein